MPFSSRCMTDADWAEVKHFTPNEFRHPEKIGYEFMLWIDKVREKAGVPMVPTSDWRSDAHNAEVGGAKDSAHEDVPCDAMDFGKRPRADDPNWNRSRYAITFAAHELGCRRFGEYKDGSLHLDRSEDRRPADVMWVQVDNKA